MEFNFTETLLTFALLLTSVLVQSQVGSALAFISSLILVAMVPGEDQRAATKRVFLLINMVVTIALIILKLALFFSGIAQNKAES